MAAVQFRGLRQARVECEPATPGHRGALEKSPTGQVSRHKETHSRSKVPAHNLPTHPRDTARVIARLTRIERNTSRDIPSRHALPLRSHRGPTLGQSPRELAP